MSMTDPLADMFSRIRNGSKAKFEKVDIPSSKLKKEIVKILKEEGFINNYKTITGSEKHEMIRIFLRYDASRKGVIHLKRVSKPGCRVYTGHAELPQVRGGLGVTVISTSQGVITDRQARKLNVGGEVLCEIW